MVEDGDFSWPKPFWEQPLWRWDAMFAAGVRAHYQASQLVAPEMIARQRGLIVNISFWAAQKRIGNVACGDVLQTGLFPDFGVLSTPEPPINWAFGIKQRVLIL
jgi:NAD(P)-dependent dehydrogenase (short-subunit alcohol dehydrogenase family)